MVSGERVGLKEIERKTVLIFIGQILRKCNELNIYHQNTFNCSDDTAVDGICCVHVSIDPDFLCGFQRVSYLLKPPLSMKSILLIYSNG